MPAFLADEKPEHLARERTYSRGEIVSDGCVHAAALVAALLGGVVLVLATLQTRTPGEIAAVSVYALALVTMLGCSFAYNMTPPSPLKWFLRRFDLAGIYLLIAGTYTPLLTQMPDRWTAFALGAAVWAGAAAGVVMVLFFPGRGERYKLALYLGLAWIAILAAGPLLEAFSPTALALIIGGGLIYTGGVAFFIWSSLRFQNVIWHGHVVTAASCHFAAIANIMVF
jgi:hemolysin III